MRNYYAVLQDSDDVGSITRSETEAPRKTTCLRVQFFADIGMHTDSVMVVTGSIPELTDLGTVNIMKNCATS